MRAWCEGSFTWRIRSVSRFPGSPAQVAGTESESTSDPFIVFLGLYLISFSLRVSQDFVQLTIEEIAVQRDRDD